MSREPLWRALQSSLLAGEAIALATVVQQRGSAPQPEGASLMVRSDGSLLGAVSAGCLETDVASHSLRVLKTGVPELHRYQAVDNNDPLAFGLSCGGSLELAIERWSPDQLPVLQLLFEALANDEEVVLATSLETSGAVGVRTASQCVGNLPASEHEQLLTCSLAPEKEGAGRHWPARAWISHTSDGSRIIWRQHRPATPLWIFGATDTANALAALARPLGFRSTVVDARAQFATEERCAAADSVVCGWPHRWFEAQMVNPATVICVLNHDPKFEIPLLTRALRSPAGYIGAMGSRSTHRQRLQALQQEGLSDAELERLRAPIGLDLGGRTAAEIALAILAEVVMLRCGGGGNALIHGQGPLHRR
jgi:xanthine dehydrogenase accessory factor